MTSAFLITLREGLEAGLVVAIVLAYLRQLGRRDAFPAVGLGAGAAVVLCLVVGTALYFVLGGLGGESELLAFAATSLIATAVLTWMIFWMRQQSRTISGRLRAGVDRALAAGTLTALASVVFFGVAREGLETVLFLLAVIVGRSALDLAIGSGVGLLGAVALSYAFYQGGRRVNLRLFFQITGGLIILVAAGLLSRGTAWLQEAGVLNTYHWPLWNLSDGAVLGHGPFAEFLNGLFGWNPQPSLEEGIAWLVFLVGASWLFYFGLPSFAWLPRVLPRATAGAPNASLAPQSGAGPAHLLLAFGAIGLVALGLLALTRATEARPEGTVGLGEEREERLKGDLATVTISLNEWSISIDPESVDAKEIKLDGRNVGSLPHEAVFIATDLAAEALPVDPVSNRVAEDAPGLRRAGEMEIFLPGHTPRIEGPTEGVEAGAREGEAEEGELQLAPGRYVVVCNIPGHYQNGMYAVLTVR